MAHPNNYPKLHNAAWPGVVGKGSPGAEPFLDLDTMLDLTAKASVDGVRFDGVDLFLFAPHVDIDSTDDDLKRLADKVRSRNLVIGSVVAPVWPPTGGGSAMGGADEPKKLDQALATLTAALRPWTIDFHIAQNDATVKGSGTHEKTGHHCLPADANGKLDIARHAGHWLRDSYGNVTRKFRHVCWDGCMFPNETMMKPDTWNGILATMVAVRDA